MTESKWLASEDPARMLRHMTHWPLGLRGEGSGSGDGPPRDKPLASDRKLRLLACVLAKRRGVADWRQYEDGGTFDILGPMRGWPATVGTLLNITAEKAEAARTMRCIVGNPFRAGMALVQGSRLGSGGIDVSHPRWLTEEAEKLAEAAYDERLPAECRACAGKGERHVVLAHIDGTPKPSGLRPCDRCNGKGRFDDTQLDPARLLVLSDALEEAGCIGDECDGPCREYVGVGKIPDDQWLRRPQWLDCPACKGTGRLPHPLLAHLRSPGPHWRGCHALDLVLGLE